ncbi:CapA family protein [Streptomyces sp. NPDC051776]|uniref:CapA family protein n=1 Tax=Streptomyces sp. NPDC051776 TaxID=3155414 RepID=UPI003412D7B3
MREDPVTLSLCGDVMLGRGVDAILPCPGDPGLREPYIRDARAYVALAEAASGQVPHPADFAWPWGEALRVLDETAPDVRVVNLETSITQSDDFAPGKEVHYRLNPANLPCLAAVRPDVCVLANNHVLDFGEAGLEETLDALAGAGLRAVGAGRNADEADRPAVVDLGGGRRVLVFSFGMPSSGIPRRWAATADRPGVGFVPGPSYACAAEVTDRIRQIKRPGDVVVVSVHWGPNWGYDVSRDEVVFAHALIDGGVDIVHGHSSHHPRPVELYRDKLVLYGCGDFIDDYEGITGHEEFRDDLRLLWFVTVDPDSGRLTGARIVPLQAHRMRLRPAARQDCAWLCDLLDRMSDGAEVHVIPGPGGASMALERV